VRVTYPDRREELVTRQAVQPIAFEATDDFRISRARLRYRIGESEESETKTIDLEPGTNVVKECATFISGVSAISSRRCWKARASNSGSRSRTTTT